MLKRVVSISLGSSSRNHKVRTNILGTDFEIERIGTDGCIKSMKEKIKSLDGKVDAFGLGGIDLYLFAGKKKYTLKEAEQIARYAKKTPVVDGSGLKNTLERKALKHLNDTGWEFRGKKVLMVCGLDRFGMAETFESYQSEIIYGDLIFSIGVPIKIYSLDKLHKIAGILMPLVKHMPFKMLYPTGSKQNKVPKPKFEEVFRWADIIAGDLHYIKKHIPKDLAGKTIITNTVTMEDIELLHSKNLDNLITTTPELNGRSFGTNVMEGVLVALAQKFPLKDYEYEKILEEVNFKPRVLQFKDYQTRRELSHG